MGTGRITLTTHLSLEAGVEVAEKIYRRHTLLSNFLISLGVDEATATEDACKIEHRLSDASFAAFERFIKEKKENENV